MVSFESYDDFLNSCVKKGKIPMSFVRTPEFLELLKQKNIVKEPAYEELCYSRDEQLNISNTRNSARYYYEHEDIFSKNGNEVIADKMDLNLGEGYEHYTFLSRSTFTHENVKGTKYIGLRGIEEQRMKKVDVDMIVSRHTLLDCLLVFFKKMHFNHCMVSFDDQIFSESKRTVSTKIDEKSMTGYNLEEAVTFKSLNETKGKFIFTPPVNNASKFNSMIIHNFSNLNIKLLVSCEIDAMIEDPNIIRSKCDETAFKREILNNYVELKSKSKLIMEKKTLLQCYASNTKHLNIGLKDKNLHLKKMFHFDVDTLLKSDEKLNRDILDKWFAFITQFIKLTIQKFPKIYEKGYFRMMAFPQDDTVKIFPQRLTQEEIDLVVIPSFINWRIRLRRMIKNSKTVYGVTAGLETMSIQAHESVGDTGKDKGRKKKNRNTDKNSPITTVQVNKKAS